MVASAENVLKSTENNSKSCEKPLNGRHDMVFLHTYLTEVRMLAPHALKGQKLLAQGVLGNFNRTGRKHLKMFYVYNEFVLFLMNKSMF